MFPRCAWTVLVCLAGLGWVVQSEVATAQAVSSGDSAVAISAEAQAITIGLDNRNVAPEHPTYGLLKSNFSEFRATLAGLGYTSLIKNSFTTSDLAGLDALILYTPPAISGPGFTSDEISAIQAFVQGGGGLLVVGECFSQGENVDGLNQILSPYGVQYSASCNSGYIVDGEFWYHPLTRGISSVRMLNQLGMTFTAPALDMTVDNSSSPFGGGPDFLAAREGDGGAGNVVCITDSHMWCDNSGYAGIDIYARDHLLLLQNVLQFIVGQNPYDCSGPIPADFFRSVFESSSECWEQISAVPAFVAPVFSRGGGGIGLSPDGSTSAFGYWSSPVLSVEPGEGYGVAWVVRSTTTPDLCPQFRLRINDVLGRDAVYRAVESRMAGENSPGTSEVWYGILYDVPDSVSEITVSFDLLSFDGTDDLSSTVQLQEVMVFPYSYLLTLEPAAQVQWIK